MKKHKTKIVYRNIKSKEEKIDTSKMENEILELDKKKEGIKGSGFFGSIKAGLQKASINAAINRKKQTIGAIERTAGIKAQTNLIKGRVELARAQSELAELRKKNQINFEQLTGLQRPEGHKSIKLEDLY